VNRVVNKQSNTSGMRTVRQRLAALLTDQPMTVTMLGSRTGYDFFQIHDAMRKLQKQGRALPVSGGWVRGQYAAES
jgi:hypothetical protein